jgi:predicted amidophosphoribosyltransferase
MLPNATRNQAVFWLLLALLALQCLCAGCAELYDYAAKGCPMCRQPVEELLTMEL